MVIILSKFHINGEGRSLRCSVTTGSCAFADTPHFDNKKDAEQYYEHVQAVNMFSNTVKNLHKRTKHLSGFKKFALIGGTLAATFSLSACNTMIDVGSQPQWQNTDSNISANKESETTDLTEDLDQVEQINDDSINDVSEENATGETKPSWSDKLGAYVSSDDAKQILGELGDLAAQELSKELDSYLPNGLNLPSNKVESGGSSSPTNIEGVYFQGKPLRPTQSEIDTARSNLQNLVEMNESTAGNYNRKQMFGNNSSATTGRIEHRDIPDAIFDGGKETSRAIAGGFIDPYTGEWVEVIQGSSEDTNLEHIVALSEVYRSELPGKPLTNEQRKAVANDPLNLQITGAAVNKFKSDKDAADYLPSYEPAQCQFAIAVITVKSKYELTVDSPEKQALQQVMDAKCVAR